MDDRFKDEHKIQQISPHNHNKSKILFISLDTRGFASFVTDDGYLCYAKVPHCHNLSIKDVLCICKEHINQILEKLNKENQDIYFKAYQKAMEIKDFTYREKCLGCGEVDYVLLLVVINDEAIPLACDGIMFGLVKAYEVIEICQLLKDVFFFYLPYLDCFIFDPDNTYFKFFSEHLPNPPKISKQKDASKCIIC